MSLTTQHLQNQLARNIPQALKQVVFFPDSLGLPRQALTNIYGLPLRVGLSFWALINFHTLFLGVADSTPFRLDTMAVRVSGILAFFCKRYFDIFSLFIYWVSQFGLHPFVQVVTLGFNHTSFFFWLDIIGVNEPMNQRLRS